MRMRSGLALAGLLAFNLGATIAPANAADPPPKKSDIELESWSYQKLTSGDASGASSCAARKGTLVDLNGDKYCRTAKAAAPTATGPAPTVPSNQRK